MLPLPGIQVLVSHVLFNTSGFFFWELLVKCPIIYVYMSANVCPLPSLPSRVCLYFVMLCWDVGRRSVSREGRMHCPACLSRSQNETYFSQYLGLCFDIVCLGRVHDSLRRFGIFKKELNYLILIFLLCVCEQS